MKNEDDESNRYKMDDCGFLVDLDLRKLGDDEIENGFQLLRE